MKKISSLFILAFFHYQVAMAQSGAGLSLFFNTKDFGSLGTKEQKKLFDTALKGKPLKSDLLLTLLLDRELKNVGEGADPARLRQLGEWIGRTQSKSIKAPFGLKQQVYEKLGINSYDISSVFLPDVKDSQSIQCASGTLLFLLSSLKNNLDLSTYVVIFTPGHVLPGYVAKDGNDFVLHGIEMTVKGNGHANFGKLRELNDASNPIRVIDATAWLLLLGVGPQLTMTPDAQLDKLVRFTSYKYKDQIPFTEMEKDLSQNATCSSSPNYYAGSRLIGGFGKASVPPGKRRLETKDEVDFRGYFSSMVETEDTETIQVEDPICKQVPIKLKKPIGQPRLVGCHDSTGHQFSYFWPTLEELASSLGSLDIDEFRLGYRSVVAFSAKSNIENMSNVRIGSGKYGLRVTRSFDFNENDLSLCDEKAGSAAGGYKLHVKIVRPDSIQGYPKIGTKYYDYCWAIWDM